MPADAPGSARPSLPAGFDDVLSFPLLQALLGRRARRFSMGASIPDGPLAHTSNHEPMPLSELACSCYAGVLMLQAMGLGGWMFDGIDRHTILGATGDPRAPGLRFRFDVDSRWTMPNPTGLPGVFEAFCPPHYPDMRAAVDALCERKFSKGGPFNPGTPGAWKESPRVRGAALVHDARFRECVAHMAQVILERFGKFPGTVPSVFCLTYLQAHHLDLEFYDTHFQPGAYLPTHARHLERWHPGTRAT